MPVMFRCPQDGAFFVFKALTPLFFLEKSVSSPIKVTGFIKVLSAAAEYYTPRQMKALLCMSINLT